MDTLLIYTNKHDISIPADIKTKYRMYYGIYSPHIFNGYAGGLIIPKNFLDLDFILRNQPSNNTNIAIIIYESDFPGYTRADFDSILRNYHYNYFIVENGSYRLFQFDGEEETVIKEAISKLSQIISVQISTGQIKKKQQNPFSVLENQEENQKHLAEVILSKNPISNKQNYR